jgi:hypothetical protein
MRRSFSTARLREIIVTMACHLLHQGGEAKGKIVDFLTEAEGDAVPVLVESLQRHPLDAINTNARHAC